ncbi:unnamed protein product [Arctia plantaginis]|uniref:Uncharacterized protein n=1 Tax=Arctia plantaginis TaxID=874455 RepID=A0A8S0Z6I3_ARCPL|nr:unnamed protein product [Arctia plantaginis]
MEVVGPSYATVAGALATASGGPPAIPAALPDAPAAGLDAAPGVAPAAAPAAGKKQPTTRYPPLVVEKLPDWPTHFRELKKLLTEQANAPRNDVQKVTVVAAPLEGTKAKRAVQPQLVPKPATVNLDPRLTSVIGTLQKVLVALLENHRVVVTIFA